MKRFIFYIAIFFLSLVFSTAFTFIYCDSYWVFARGSFGTCGDLEKGFKGGGGFTSYEFYDGTKLSYSRAGFDSVADAKGCFEEKLAETSEIIERAPYFDEKHEKIIGERVVVKFPPNEYAKDGYSQIIYFDGENIWEITSTSLKHARNFEKNEIAY